jgi:hypothetical protein
MTHTCPIPLPRYSHEQLATLDHIGRAYTDKRIDFDRAVTLRDLVRAKRIGEALDSLMSAKRRTA